MFEHLVDSSPVRKKSNRLSYFALTAVVWVTALAAALAAGVMAYDATLSETYEIDLLMLPRLPVALGTRDEGPKPQEQEPAPRQFQSVRDIPKGLITQNAPPRFESIIPIGTGDSTGGGGSTGIGVGDPLGVPFGVAGSGSDSGKTPEPPPVVAVPKHDAEPVTRQLRRSGGVFQGSAIRRPEPLYPELARRAGIAGQVVVEVVIDERGNVISARALSGHLLLRQSAVEAARQWKWNPTYLTGVPVQVVGSITFNFTLH